jgi:hypothetical protein
MRLNLVPLGTNPCAVTSLNRYGDLPLSLLSVSLQS